MGLRDEHLAPTAERELLKAHWSRKAEGYDRIEGNAFSDRREADVWSAQVRRHLPDHAHSLLEVGVGTGVLYELLVDIAVEVVGIDISFAMISVARRRLKAAGKLGLLAVADAEALPFGPAVFDAIICRYMAWTLFDLSGSLVAWHRSLRHHGRVICIENERRRPLWQRRLLSAFARVSFLLSGQQRLIANDKDYERIGAALFFKRGFDSELFGQVAMGAGFEVVTVEPLDDILRLENRKTTLGHRLLRVFSRPVVIVLTKR